MPIVPIVPINPVMGTADNPLPAKPHALSVPIVPIIYPLKVVGISIRGVMGTCRRVHARRSLKCLGTLIGTGGFDARETD